LSSGRWRQLAHAAVRAASEVGSDHLVLDLRQAVQLGAGSLPAAQFGNLLSQGLELGTYRYDRYIAEARRKPITVKRVTVRGLALGGLLVSLGRGRIVVFERHTFGPSFRGNGSDQ
jgi:hypothetical protein